jgi:hypothetical protein
MAYPIEKSVWKSGGMKLRPFQGFKGFGTVDVGTTGVVCPPYPPFRLTNGYFNIDADQKAYTATIQQMDMLCMQQVAIVKAQQAQAEIDAANAAAYQAQLAASAKAAADAAAAEAAIRAAADQAQQKAAADEAAHVAAEQAAQWASDQAIAQQVAMQAQTAAALQAAQQVLEQARMQAAAWAAEAARTAADQAAQADAANAAAAVATQAAADQQASAQAKIQADAAAAQVAAANAATAAIAATEKEYADWQRSLNSGPSSVSLTWKTPQAAASPPDVQIAYVLRRWAGHALWEVPPEDRARMQAYLRLAWEAGAQFPRSVPYTPILAAVEPTVGSALIRRDAGERAADRERWANDLDDVRNQDRAIQIYPTKYQQDWGTFGIEGFHIENDLGALGSIIGGVAGTIIPGAGTAMGAAIGGALGKLGTQLLGTGPQAQTGKAAQGVIVGIPADFMALRPEDLLYTVNGQPVDPNTGVPYHPSSISSGPSTSTLLMYGGFGLLAILLLTRK